MRKGEREGRGEDSRRGRVEGRSNRRGSMERGEGGKRRGKRGVKEGR